MRAVITILILIGAAACSKDSVKSNKMYSNGVIEIALKEVKDSRCPEDVICIWEGSAAVALEVTKDKEVTLITLHTYKGFRKDTLLFGYNIQLTDVKPYPRTGKSYELKDYKVTLNVTPQ